MLAADGFIFEVLAEKLDSRRLFDPFSRACVSQRAIKRSARNARRVTGCIYVRVLAERDTGVIFESIFRLVSRLKGIGKVRFIVTITHSLKIPSPYGIYYDEYIYTLLLYEYLRQRHSVASLAKGNPTYKGKCGLPNEGVFQV